MVVSYHCLRAQLLFIFQEKLDEPAIFCDLQLNQSALGALRLLRFKRAQKSTDGRDVTNTTTFRVDILPGGKN
jgi:hypothetical protein